MSIQKVVAICELDYVTYRQGESFGIFTLKSLL